MDRDVNTSMDGFWLLSCMNGQGGEAMMPKREVLALWKLLVLNFAFSLFV
jgi:hypothetical protein